MAILRVLYTTSLKNKSFEFSNFFWLLESLEKSLVNGFIHSAIVFLFFQQSHLISLSQRIAFEVSGHWTSPKGRSIKTSKSICNYSYHTQAMQRKTKTHLKDWPMSIRLPRIPLMPYHFSFKDFFNFHIRQTGNNIFKRNYHHFK